MKVIILAAGQGARLAPYTNDTPKCLLRIGDISLLWHQLDNCQAAGIEETVIVTGFKFEAVDQEIDRWLQQSPRTLKVRTSYNPFFDVSNNLVSLWVARSELTESVITINGDNVFDWRILEELSANDSNPILVTIDEKDSYDQDDMKIVLKNEHIQRMNKGIPEEEANAESIGIMRFSGAGLILLRNMLEIMIREPEFARGWYVQAIERIALAEEAVGVMRVREKRWAEVDFEEDLEYVRANLHEIIPTKTSSE